MEIKIENLKYKDTFDNLNLTLSSDKIIGIVGKNGAGKSSLLNLIYGSNKDFKGKIYIRDDKLQREKKKISYLKQDSCEYLFFKHPLDYLKQELAKIDNEKLNNLLDLFGLKKDALYKEWLLISNSEIKKILLIKVLMEDFSILLLDAPTNDLDQKSISNLIRYLKRKKHDDKNLIIILSTTDSDFLLKVADEIFVLSNKKIFSDSKFNAFNNIDLLNEIGIKTPDIIQFYKIAFAKKIKLIQRDNINDLIKDVYRNARV